MKAKVFEARMGKIENVPLEKELNQFIAGVKEVHFITQSECAVNQIAARRFATPP